MSEIARCPLCGKDVKRSIWRPEYEGCAGSVVVTVKCCGMEALTVELWNQYAAAIAKATIENDFAAQRELAAIEEARGFREIEKLRDQLAASEQRVKALEDALTPSAETKIAFISEFSFRPSGYIANKYSDAMERVIVPWVTIKEIMKAIKQRAEATCQK